MSLKVLLAQTQAQSVQTLAHYLKKLDAEVSLAFDLGEASAILATQEYDLMILDLGFPGPEWQEFLSIAKAEYPKMKVVLTSEIQNREREQQAQEMGVSTVLRQPFTEYWFFHALKSVGLLPTPVTAPRRPVASRYRVPEPSVPLGLKLTLPFLAVIVLVALGSIAIAASYFNRNAQAGLDSQLSSTNKLASTWLANLENEMAQTSRLIANAQNVPSLIQSGDSSNLRLLALPVAANSDEETVEILNAQGASVLSLRKTPEDLPGLYNATSGETFFQNVDFVKQALQSGAGTSTSGFARAPWGNYFYVCSPIAGTDGKVVGAVLTGRSPEHIVQQLQSVTQANVTFYDGSGKPLASTLFTGSDSRPLDQPVLQQITAGQPGQSPTRDLKVGGAQYSEVLSAWQVPGGPSLGTYGLAVQRSPLITFGNLDLTEILSFLAAAILIVVLIGLLLANSTTSRIKQLTQASAEIAGGNMNVPIDTEGNDEFAALAKSFKLMIDGLREGELTRDVLGHSATPELREELRQSLMLQNLRLEGQEMTATILKTSLTGFQDLVNQGGAVQTFEWLNEYYGLLAPIVNQHGGIINRLDGSSMTASFGILPFLASAVESASEAYEAASHMLRALESFNAARVEAGEPLMETSIAIDTSQVIAGALSYDEKLDYILFGEAVNGVDSLSDLAPVLGKGSHAYVSQATATLLEESGSAYPLDPIAIRERNDPASQRYVYRLLSRQATGETEVQA